MSLPERLIVEPFARLGVQVGFFAVHLARGATIDVDAAALRPTASVFKVPVMVEVFRQARAGRFALSDRVPMTEAQRTIGSGVLRRLDPGLALTVRDMVMLMIIVSDNSATDVLVDLVGAAEVTACMRALGLADIHVPSGTRRLFATAYGLPPAPLPDYESLVALGPQAPDYAGPAYAGSPDGLSASPRDMARLCAMIHRNEAGPAEDCAEMLRILLCQQSRDRVPRWLPDSCVANKTGTFAGVRNDAGLILRGTDDVIAFALFTFDPTPLPAGPSRLAVERTHLVAAAMADVGRLLWDEFARVA